MTTVLDRDRMRIAAAAVLFGILAMAAPWASKAGEQFVSVIVRALPGHGAEAQTAVENAGGKIERRIGIIDGLSARIPATRIPAVERSGYVRSITLNQPIHLLHAIDGFNAASDAGSIYNLTTTMKANDLWKQGITGQGVDVALIDSGFLPVNGLSAPGKVVLGPDLSFESQADNLRYLDTFGHGTHMAGIIAGRDDGLTSNQYTSHDNFTGVAPDARIVSIKVATSTGATDVSQVLAAIDWVVQHRNDSGMNIRVLNLSFGTDGIQDYTLDPLTYAAEVAWRKGIVVVVAAGNSGYGTAKLNNPAYDPYVIAVGADDTRGTPTTDDDVVPAWSSRGDGTRNPDVVAPGKSVASLRAPGSFVDANHPEGRINSRLFRGSGTSQAAAAVSGAAALLISQRPNLAPDQVKKLLTSTAVPLPAADAVAQGAGLIQLKNAAAAPTPAYTQNFPLATGTGSLESSRGSAHVSTPEGVELRGEMDVMGKTWDGSTWSGSTWSGSTWSGGAWNGSTWSGSTWSGSTWSGSTWSGSTWSGSTWSGSTWSGSTWSGSTWSGSTWSGSTWSGSTWSGSTWSGSTWSGSTWSGSSWSGSSWSGSSWSSTGWGSEPIA
ncbi:MAG: S8 family serine peptidase [Actinomycetota bacterium]